MPSRCCEFVDSRLRRSPPDRASAVPMDKPGKTRCVSPTLPTGRRLLHKLHSTPQQHGMILISGNGEITSRLYAFSLFFPGSCPNNRDRRRGGRTLVGSRCRPVTRSGGVRRECGVSPFRMSRRPRSSLIQGILPISPVGSSQMVQNASTVTIIYEKIPRTGKLRVSSRIELGNQSSVWQGAFIGVSWQLC